MTVKLLRQTVRTHWKQLGVVIGIVTFFLMFYGLVVTTVSSVSDEVVAQSQPLIGGDIIVESSLGLPDETVAFLDEFTANNGLRSTQLISLSTTLLNGDLPPALVSVRGVESGYPLYGSTDIDAVDGTGMISIDELATREGVALDPDTYSQYVVDGSVALGSLTVPVVGVVRPVETLSLGIFDEGRTMIVPRNLLIESGLTGIGSRVEFEYLIGIPETSRTERVTTLIDVLRGEESVTSFAEVDNGARRIEQLTTISDEFDRYTRTIILTTILIVVMTMFILIRTFFTNEQRSIGILALLGQSTWSMIGLYGTLFSVCFVVGYLLAGTILSLLITLLGGSQPILPLIELTNGFVVPEGLFGEMAIVTGLIAVMSIAVPLWSIATQRPLELLRPSKLPTKAMRLAQGGVVLVGVFVLYVLTIGGGLAGLITVVAIIILVGLYSLILSGLLRGIVARARSRATSVTNFLRFDGIRSTIAPGNQSVLISIGLFISVSILATVGGITIDFLSSLRGISDTQPGVYVLNVLEDDVDYITTNYPDSSLYDVILSRILSVNGTPPPSGEFDREFNATSIFLPEEDYTSGSAPTPGTVSLDEGFAERLGAAIGDTITFFIQGRTLELTVSSLRIEGDPTQGPFFFVQYSNEQFAEAPKSYFWSVDVPAGGFDAFKRTIVEEVGSYVTVINTNALLATVSGIATTLAGVIIALMSVIAVLVIVSVWISIISMGQLRALKARLYRLLGATPSMLSRSFNSELVVLLGVGIVLGLVVAMVVVIWSSSVSSI